MRLRRQTEAEHCRLDLHLITPAAKTADDDADSTESQAASASQRLANLRRKATIAGRNETPKEPDSSLHHSL